ncbi:ABC transporter substrate-binding protein [Cohnella sp. CIP 111063]|uniref:extracellular solute-binding protein n=1 Tax=unclassified Cohnella TaxID=2636738 RepID=UPI000B9D19ED|nr:MULTISPECIES: extracellular solute-binding protein [unclassified Cohnella]OXS59820.1 ABC transporter substrate-binding protein [Cohnella sp. CIP 111063]PRX72613.1 iron(III) transport system substrate-binding protein [Cohnella sp. SGD-V74]
MKKTKTKLTGISLLLATTMMIVSACGASGNNAANGGAQPSASPSTESASPSETTPASETPSPEVQDEGTLTVYLNDFDDIIGPMFEAATGYKVELVKGNGAEIMSRIQAEKGNPHWDVVWLDAMPSIYGMGEDNQLLTDWTPDNAANLKDSYQAYVPANKSFYPTGAHAAGVIVYNTNAYTADQAPNSWDDFAKPEFKNAVGMADPAIAAPAFPFVARFFSEKQLDGGQAFFDSLFANGLKVYPKNPNVAAALSSGEIKAAALQESNAYGLVNSGEPIGIIWPEDGAPASVRVAAIQKNTKNPNAAKAFVNFLLDPATQQQLIDQGDESYFEPSVPGVNPKADRAADANLVAADAAWAFEHEAEIKQWFADKAVK